MATKAEAADMYMNFKDLSVRTDSSDASDLVEGNVQTGVSIRGKLLFLIHKVELFMPIKQLAGTTGHGIIVALSTKKGLTVMPALGDAGLITKFQHNWKLTSSGATNLSTPLVADYLPPIPVAAPQFSIYAQADVDVSTLRNALLELRMGFTTALLDAATYIEIAETWGW